MIVSRLLRQRTWWLRAYGRIRGADSANRLPYNRPMPRLRSHAEWALTLGLLAGVRLAAQNLQPSFENDQVIVNAPHPGVEVPGSAHKMHDHKLNRVMVYFHDGGELLHYLDGRTVDLKWQAGEVKWSPASGFHYSEIPPALDPRVWKTPAFSGPMGVDIGIKKAGDPAKAVGAALDTLRVDRADYKLEFENSQVRVTRVRMSPRQSVPMHEHLLNRVIVYITDANVRETSPEGNAVVIQHKAGDFSWDGPARHAVENLNDKPLEALVVEVKN